MLRTMIRVPWALSVAGISQMTRMALPIPLSQSATGIPEALSSAFRTAEIQVEQWLMDAWTLSDSLDRGAMFSLLQEVAVMAQKLAPGQTNHLVWQELHNKLESLGTFEYVERVLPDSAGFEQPLSALVEQAGKLDPYTAVWATEGIGHAYVERCLRRNKIPFDLLTAQNLDNLPSRSLITLHAGMGLSLAREALSTFSTRSTGTEIRQALHRFIASCRQNARPGYTEIALEGLGLVGRTLHPHLVPQLDEALSGIDLDMVALFWHGVGRGLYFLPVNFMPYAGSVGRAVAMALEAPHRIGRLNAVSGVAWPATLVNIRHPEIMEMFLRENHALISGSDAFSQGISAAILTWYDCVPDDPSFRAFCNYEPADLTISPRWNEQVRIPCDRALQRYYPALKAGNRLGELFRYQSLSQLAERLEQGKKQTEACPEA